MNKTYYIHGIDRWSGLQQTYIIDSAAEIDAINAVSVVATDCFIEMVL